MSVDDIMAITGSSRATVYAVRKRAGFGGRKDRAQSLFPRPPGAGRSLHKDVLNRSARLLAVTHPAVVDRRTVYLGTVSPPGERKILKSGVNNPKVGPKFVTGPWTAQPILTLTLEERATCPPTCEHSRSCYGNNIHHAQRHEFGPELERRIRSEIAELAQRYPRGFVVRLHTLGDFYSVGYVRMWCTLLEQYPALNVFGFTRRHDHGDPIAAEVVKLWKENPGRVKLRFSNAPPTLGLPSAITIEDPRQPPADAIVCPADRQKTASCSSCGLCLTSPKRIAFVQH
jgi:hypothetical protein